LNTIIHIKGLDKAGVYGYVEDELTSESVLANNPDGGTDAGQFAIIPSISPTDKTIEFEFIAAVPMEKDVSKFENGIGPLRFKSLRVISFPGGQREFLLCIVSFKSYIAIVCLIERVPYLTIALYLCVGEMHNPTQTQRTRIRRDQSLRNE
jgi:hypothetical protein